MAQNTQNNNWVNDFYSACNHSLLTRSYDFIYDVLNRNIGSVDYKQEWGDNIGSVPIVTDGLNRINKYVNSERSKYSNYWEYANKLNTQLVSYFQNNVFGLDTDNMLRIGNIYNEYSHDYDTLANESKKYLSYVDIILSEKENPNAYVFGKDELHRELPHQLSFGYVMRDAYKNIHEHISLINEDPLAALHIGEFDQFNSLSFDDIGKDLSIANNNVHSEISEQINYQLSNIDNIYGKIFSQYSAKGYDAIAPQGSMLNDFDHQEHARFNRLSNSFSSLFNAHTSFTYAEAIDINMPSNDTKETSSFNTEPLGVNQISYKSKPTYASNVSDLVRFTNVNFKNGNYKTIIAKFGTHAHGSANKYQWLDDEYSECNTALSNYGVSHGRNLLRKNGQRDVKHEGGLDYNDPYCRVWTNYHQYAHVNNMIRPFTDDEHTPTDASALYSSHGFNKVRTRASEGEVGSAEGMNHGGFENGQVRLSKEGVLRNTGFVNITPDIDAQNSVKHMTKQCMFSLENLAWKGCFDKTDFDHGLSSEQQGPFGGRIMWFPPYDIKFSESVNANWGSSKFIGRGEPIYTYTDTERNGNLSFKLVIDHPSVINYYKKDANGEANSQWEQIGPEYDMLRFFAGCGFPDVIQEAPTVKNTNKDGSATNTNGEEADATIPQNDKNSQNESVGTPNVVTGEEVSSADNSIDTIYCLMYFPNNYSGVDDLKTNIDPFTYILNGVGSQMEINRGSYQAQKIPTTQTNITYLHDNQLHGYEMNMSPNNDDNSVGLSVGSYKEMSGSTTYIPKNQSSSASEKVILSSNNFNGASKQNWWYRVDEHTMDEKLNPRSYYDVTSFGLNSYGIYGGSNVDELINAHMNINDDTIYIKTSDFVQHYGLTVEDYPFIYSFVDMYVALAKYSNKSSQLINYLESRDDLYTNSVNEIVSLLQRGVLSVETKGFISSHGTTKSNSELCTDRAATLAQLFRDNLESDCDIQALTTPTQVGSQTIAAMSNDIKDRDANELFAKLGRCAIATIKLKTSESKDIQDLADSSVKSVNESGETEGFSVIKKDTKAKTQLIERQEVLANTVNSDGSRVRYDNEYEYFKKLKLEDSFIYHKITDKIKYFDPAYHAISPEGFNARLTFLQQCMRQGPTIGRSSEALGQSGDATNMAFGRAPICVLRLGDFYYTKIVIKSLSIHYDPLVWDINQEGAGLQPMIAQVDIGFSFIGGSDIEGPIARLQNAVSFNYYANTSIYDNRAEKITYDQQGNVANYDSYEPQVHMTKINTNIDSSNGASKTE